MVATVTDSVSLAALLNDYQPGTPADAAETPRDWVAGGFWVSGETYQLDPEETTENRAVIADGSAAVRWSPAGEYCGGGHRTGPEGEAGHWCPADRDEWTEEEDARGVVRDWRAVSVWDANGFSETTVHATVEAAKTAFTEEVAELKAMREQED